MTKNQRVRLEACNTALLEVISISNQWSDAGVKAGDDGLLLSQVEALNNIAIVLGGIVDELK